MKIVFEKTDLPKNSEFRKQLKRLLKKHKYESWWVSSTELEVEDMDIKTIDIT